MGCHEPYVLDEAVTAQSVAAWLREAPLAEENPRAGADIIGHATGGTCGLGDESSMLWCFLICPEDRLMNRVLYEQSSCDKVCTE